MFLLKKGWNVGFRAGSLRLSMLGDVLVVAWNERTVKSLNSWGMELVLGLNLLALDLGEIFIIFNIYGPYLNRIPF